MQGRTIEDLRGDSRQEARRKRFQLWRKTAITEPVAFQGNGYAGNVDEGLPSGRSFDDSHKRVGV